MAYAGKIDESRTNVEIHNEKYNARLEESLDALQDVLLAGIDKLDIRPLGILDRLVALCSIVSKSK